MTGSTNANPESGGGSDLAENKVILQDYLDRHDWRFRWRSTRQAVSYISRLSRDHSGTAGKTTEQLLLATLALVAVLCFSPPQYLTQVVVLCDLAFGVSVVLFIAFRFGILNSLNPKQAAAVWELIIAIALFAIFLVFQLAVVYALLRLSVKL